MRTRTIGGITVSAIGLGGMPMSIEGRPDEKRSIAHHSRRAGRGRHAHRHRRRVSPGARRDRAQRAADRQGPGQLWRGRQRGAGRHEGRPPAPRRRLVDRGRLPRPPPGSGRGVAQGARRGHDRPLPVPPAGPGSALRGVHRRAEGPARRREDPAGRHLQRHHEQIDIADPGPRPGPPGQRAEPVLPRVPVQRAGTAALRRPGRRVPALEPARRHRPGRPSWAAGTPPSRRWPDAHGVSPQQVTLAWMLALAPVVIPIPGASRPESITDSAKAAGLQLTGAEVAGSAPTAPGPSHRQRRAFRHLL